MTALRRLLVATAALVAAVAVFVWATLPPRTATLAIGVDPRTVFGAYHIHTLRSDGGGSVDDVARAAARAGLQFVVVTDHGDATRAPDAPAYRHGVLVLDAVEIGTDEGHVVAIGLREASPYPLGGRAVDVIEDVHRAGGWTVAAHPDSPKPGLQWRAAAAPYDAVEWINADSEWRDEPVTRLAMTAARALVRPAESIATLFADPSRSVRRWDAAAALRSVAGLAAVDAHARLGTDETGGGGLHLRVPTYEQMFRTLSQALVLDAPLSGDAAADAAGVVAALRAGRTYSVVRALAWPAVLRVTALAGGASRQLGDRWSAGVESALSAVVDGGGTARVTWLRNGVEVATGRGSAEYRTDAIVAGAYRAVVHRDGAIVPWIVSSPIYAGEPAAATTAPVLEPPAAVLTIGRDAPWTIEREPRSEGQFDWEGSAVRLDYSLAAGASSGQYAALTVPVTSDNGFDRIQFVARSDRPMRLSVQALLPTTGADKRWRRSVYVDREPRLIVVPVAALQPVAAATAMRPISSTIQGLLFVVDTVNTAPGTRGSVWLSDVALGVAARETAQSGDSRGQVRTRSIR